MIKALIIFTSFMFLLSCSAMRPPELDSSSYELKIGHRDNQPTESGLKAGFANDNKQFNYFLGFLEKYKKQVENYPIYIKQRIILTVKDQNELTVPNADIKIFKENNLISSGKTFSDGSYNFYPTDTVQSNDIFKVKYQFNQDVDSITISATGKRQINLKINKVYAERDTIPVDVLFILDTTGSMGEEIQRLLTAIHLIHLNLQTYSNNINIRFGLVLYRDREDKYITKVIQLTGNLEEFRKELSKVKAGGGGDNPEDLQSALKASMQKINWNENGIRIGFIITDASAHLDYGQKYTYAHAAEEAKKKGIKLFSIGTGGLSIQGEYILRQISQYTQAKYIFLTYGEKGDSEGGSPGSVSHHTGSNYDTDKLEAIIIRFAKEEIALFSHRKINIENEYFRAEQKDDIPKEITYIELFGSAFSQLIDYSTIKITKESVLGILPIEAADSTALINAEYFTDQLSTLIKNIEFFRMTERIDLQKVTTEVGLQLSGITDDKNATKIGNFLGADYLISGKLYKKNENYELFLKLLRVQTAEVLSITHLIIDKKLGL